MNGREPVVILNDAPEFADIDLRDFDNVIVSPGPGHPANLRDFGAAARLTERCDLPVLGVSLGHQGIAVAEHALVEPAPEPRHGHLSTIRHSGRGLFRGLPQGFTAVRYHSLHVPEPLPATLEATAWAEDGVLMGLRHRTRPLWGVQFHIDSVLTEFGYRMLSNFRDFTAQRRPYATGLFVPRDKRPHRREPAAEEATVPLGGYRLHTRTMGYAVDPEEAFGRLHAGAVPTQARRAGPRTRRLAPGDGVDGQLQARVAGAPDRVDAGRAR